MDKKHTYWVKEKAQVLPILVVAVAVLIAMGALLIDGGTLISNRRAAQAAADAGALAGAHELCYPTGVGWEAAATNYVTQNNAQLDGPVTLVGGKVQVKAKITNDSFFAGIFNVDDYTATAEAEAGCFAPYGNFLLPVAWSCRPPVEGAPFDPDLGCQMMALDWKEQVLPLISGEKSSIEINGTDYYRDTDGTSIIDEDGYPPPQIYIVMDKLSVDFETLCKEDLDPADPAYLTAIVCDLDGDGKMDIEGGGNRGWLDLDGGGGGASDMVEWIEEGLDFPLATHTWLSGQPGTTNRVYTAMENRRQSKQPVLIPVFNAICDDKDPTTVTSCMNAAHANPPWEDEPASGDIDGSDQTPQFHVITFDNFFITCVHQHQSDHCPGFALAQEMNPDPKNDKKSLIPDNTPTVEGFFLTNAEPDPDPEQNCDINLGNCTVSLSK